MRSESIVVCTERRSVNGGQSTTSTASVSFLSSRYESFWVNWIATKWSWCIFQFAAMIGLRSVMTRPSRVSTVRCVVRSVRTGRGIAQRLQAGEVALLDELERRAAAGAHVVDGAVEPELADRRGAVAAPDDREAGAFGDRGRDRLRARRERRHLEHTHRAVPQHHVRLGDRVREDGRGLGPDVEPHPSVWDPDRL